MFLRLKVYKASSNPAEYTWVNFNKVSEIKANKYVERVSGKTIEFTYLYLDFCIGEEIAHITVTETPEVIFELLKENTAVKVLFGGN